MEVRTYSSRSNAIRAARGALAAQGVRDAMSGVHFKLELDGEEWAWRQIDPATGAVASSGELLSEEDMRAAEHCAMDMAYAGNPIDEGGFVERPADEAEVIAEQAVGMPADMLDERPINGLDAEGPAPDENEPVEGYPASPRPFEEIAEEEGFGQIETTPLTEAEVALQVLTKETREQRRLRLIREADERNGRAASEPQAVKAPREPKAAGAPRKHGPKVQAKLEAMIQQALTPEGVSEGQLARISGWKKFGFFYAAAKEAGLKLTRSAVNGEQVWHASQPAAEQQQAA